MIFSDEDLLPISGLQHLIFCERQCALIHVEGLWTENRLTTEGRLLHALVDRGDRADRCGKAIDHNVPLRSDRLGLYGRADVVEYGVGEGGTVVPFPVEYKRGRRTPRRADESQLCAQAMCLEEMVGSPVPRGAIYHGASRRRRPVEFTMELRQTVEQAAARFRALVYAGTTPRPKPGPHCRSCSLSDLCQPRATALPENASSYVARLVRGVHDEPH